AWALISSSRAMPNWRAPRAACWRRAAESSRLLHLARTRIRRVVIVLLARQPIDHVAAHVCARRAHGRNESRVDQLDVDVVAAIAPVFFDPLLEAARAVICAEIVIHHLIHLHSRPALPARSSLGAARFRFFGLRGMAPGKPVRTQGC